MRVSDLGILKRKQPVLAWCPAAKELLFVKYKVISHLKIMSVADRYPASNLLLMVTQDIGVQLALCC